jgi:hypothetical protein
MHADVGHGGVKKFRQLILVHPDHAVIGIEGYRGFTVHGIVYNDILPVFIHNQSSSTAFSSARELSPSTRISTLISASERIGFNSNKIQDFRPYSISRSS